MESEIKSGDELLRRQPFAEGGQTVPRRILPIYLDGNEDKSYVECRRSLGRESSIGL